MKKKYIKDLKPGEQIYGDLFAVKGYKKGATRNNKPFIDLQLSDKTGMVKAKIWSDDMPRCETVELGDVVLVTGTVEEFMSNPQIRVTNLSKTENYDLEELQEKTTFNIEDMWNDIEAKINEIKNPHLKDLLKNIFDTDFTERFKKAPAAFKVHHGYMGGLIEHTWEMVKMAEPLKLHFPKINMDLVNAGIILHDIGKVEEMVGGTTVTQTIKGKLLGHIYLGAEIIEKKAPKDMPEDLLDEILHIVLSHIGIKEYGSPTVPMTSEAMAVFVIDYASTRIRMAYNQIEGESGSEMFTSYIPQLNAELYRSPYGSDITNEDIPF